MYTKKLIFSLCLLASSFFAHSQAQETPKQASDTYLETGTWLLGGGLSYINVSTKYGNQSISNGLFLGAISAANMVSPNIAIGGKVTYANISNSGAAILGPMARYYFNNNKPTMPYLMSEVTFNTQGGSAGYNFGLGLANFVSKNVSIDMTATYGNSYTVGGIPSGTTSSSVSVGVFALQAGLQIYLPKRK
jgi:hypothetical protein